MSYYKEIGLNDEDVKKYILNKDYLDEKGWLRSVERAEPIDGAINNLVRQPYFMVSGTSFGLMIIPLSLTWDGVTKLNLPSFKGACFLCQEKGKDPKSTLKLYTNNL